MRQILKKLVGRLPERAQTELKRLHYERQIGKGTFVTDEPEYKLLHELIAPGDWVIDVGANVGHYTKRLSELVGKNGRVIAFEPVPATFSILSANTQHFAYPNTSLIEAAVSDKLDTVGMSMPSFETGLVNYYEAKLTPTKECAFSVLTISLDSLCINQPISLVKIDVEGHERQVIKGMQELINADHPTLIVETGNEELIDYISSLGYDSQRLNQSPNVLFSPT